MQRIIYYEYDALLKLLVMMQTCTKANNFNQKQNNKTNIKKKAKKASKHKNKQNKKTKTEKNEKKKTPQKSTLQVVTHHTL